MVRHMILWKLKEEYPAEEKEKILQGIREGLEGLAGQIPGMLSICVQTDKLPSSSADAMLNSAFESPEALKAYSVHPAHVAVADSKVRPFVQTRLSMDFEE